MFCKNILHSPVSQPRAIARMRMTLLSFGLFDEIITGLPVVGLPLLRDHLGLSYEQIGLLFAVGGCSAMVLEPIINVLSDHDSKRWWILGGLFCLILSFVMAASTSSYSILLLVFALYYPAIGTAVGLAEATLIDADPASSVATMTRWTMLASIGDILAPLLVTGLVSLHQGWSSLCWLAACLWIGLCLLTAVQPFPRQVAEESEPTLAGATTEQVSEKSRANTWRTLSQAVRNPRLLRWGLLALIPTMVDEVLLGFVALYLHDILHASESTIGLLLAGTLLSSLLGLALLDRLSWLRWVAHQSPHRLLAGMAVAVLAGMFLLLTTHVIWQAGLALGVVGLGSAGWYPIAQAQTYAQLPGRSSLVRAITGLGAPFDTALPAIVGFLSARFGLLAGLTLLGCAPLLMLLALIGYVPTLQKQETSLE
ncbi:MFS transporter [Ktedonobacteria bacterium brp13]|nr:MFS transporter [Ktedonobacteria bacterium brp13]